MEKAGLVNLATSVKHAQEGAFVFYYDLSNATNQVGAARTRVARARAAPPLARGRARWHTRWLTRRLARVRRQHDVTRHIWHRACVECVPRDSCPRPSRECAVGSQGGSMRDRRTRCS